MSSEARTQDPPWWARLTGGRPMHLLGYAFTDVVSGKGVSYWRDKFGRVWMAESRWSSFRVRTVRQ